jgi:predicted nucleotidyltransferase
MKLSTATSISEEIAQVADAVKMAVQVFDPKAKVVLFGSRARGDARKDSDYDFLILINQAVGFQLKRQILDSLYEVELRTGCVIGALIENMEAWQMMEHSPLFSSIEQDGIIA